MPLILAPATEGDIERIIEVMYAAFATDAWDRIMVPHIPAPNARSHTIERYQRQMRSDPTVSIMKVVDTDLEQIIAFASWNIYKCERPESEWKHEPKREWDKGTNVDAADTFIAAAVEKRHKIMGGKAHCLLNMLNTHPDHQRRGAGRMLVGWGVGIADEAVLPCYLEGSPAGYRLYKTAGFENVDTLDIDMSRWGGEGVYQYCLMVRPEKST